LTLPTPRSLGALGTLILLFPAAALGAEAGDAARGERAFQRCYSCHSVDPNEAAKLQGPSLYRIMGRRAAAIPGFAYSDAMREKGAVGLVWDVAYRRPEKRCGGHEHERTTAARRTGAHRSHRLSRALG